MDCPLELGLGDTYSLSDVLGCPLGLYSFSLALLTLLFLRTQEEGCGSLRRESPGAFPNSGSIFPKPFHSQKMPNLGTLPENPGECSRIVEAYAKTSPKRIWDSHSLLEFSDSSAKSINMNKLGSRHSDGETHQAYGRTPDFV